MYQQCVPTMCTSREARGGGYIDCSSISAAEHVGNNEEEMEMFVRYYGWLFPHTT